MLKGKCIEKIENNEKKSESIKLMLKENAWEKVKCGTGKLNSNSINGE